MSATGAGRTAALLACLPEATQWANELETVCPDEADRADLAWEAVKGRCARAIACTERSEVDAPPVLDDLRSLVAEIAVLLTEAGAA